MKHRFEISRYDTLKPVSYVLPNMTIRITDICHHQLPPYIIELRPTFKHGQRHRSHSRNAIYWSLMKTFSQKYLFLNFNARDIASLNRLDKKEYKKKPLYSAIKSHISFIRNKNKIKKNI